ncbi:MAG: branched-chain amino acid ABC transporter substrate-binding protein [Candidatus Symbiobacter sp.]|nr:branched-chain amino acid ABC transporter substrate-binding protein [Candidatus Symbiobacter sp.]
MSDKPSQGSNKTIITVVIAAIIIVGGYFGLRSGMFGGGGNSDHVQIGLAGPFTGPNATFGQQFRNGAKLAIEDINAKGGLLGKKVEFVEGDDQSDPKQAVSVANQFVSKKIGLVVGHFNSGASIPASDVYKEEKIVQISPASTNPTYTDRGYKNTFRVCGRDDFQGVVAGKFLIDNFKGKNIAILHDKTAYGQGLAEQTQKAFNAAGGKEVLFEAITPGEKDYTALVSKLKSLKVAAIYLGGYHPEAGLIVRQARDNKLNAVLISGDALATKEFSQITGPAGEGTIFTFEPDYRNFASAQELVGRFKTANIDPEGYTLNTYASFQVLQQAVEKAKSTKGEDVANAIRGGTFETVLGSLTFDDKGDIVDPKYVFYAFDKDGNYAEMK